MMQDIPETSYFKLIDYWLLFSLNMLALAMAFHTGLAFYIRRSRERKQEEEDDSKQKKKNTNVVVPLALAEAKEDISWTEEEEIRNSSSYKNAATLKTAKMINNVGFGMFVLMILGFNAWFWLAGFKANQLEGEEEEETAEECSSKAQ